MSYYGPPPPSLSAEEREKACREEKNAVQQQQQQQEDTNEKPTITSSLSSPLSLYYAKNTATTVECFGMLSRSSHHHKYNKKLRKDIRTVPWKDGWEFQAVGKALLSVLEDDDNNENDENDHGKNREGQRHQQEQEFTVLRDNKEDEIIRPQHHHQDQKPNNKEPPPPIMMMSIVEALEMITVWKSRSNGLPHSIESTAVLAQVYWRDSQQRRRCRQQQRWLTIPTTDLM